MIQYAPLEEDTPPLKKTVSATTTTQSSECNTLVMVFIGGVILLALMDSVK
jgi:hypothetical protein